jgi:hypothetical protein
VKLKMAILLVFLFCGGVYGQGQRETLAEAKKEEGASKEDLRKATIEMKKILSEAQKKSDARTAQLLKAAEEEKKQSEKRAEEAAKKLAAEIEKQKQAALESEKASRSNTVRIYIGIGLVFLVIVLGFVFVLTKKHESKAILVASEKPESQKTLTDPDIPAIREFARRQGTKKVLFLLKLPRDKREFVCSAEIREGMSPLVYIEGDKTPVTWEKRKQRAAEIAARKNGTTQEIPS